MKLVQSIAWIVGSMLVLTGSTYKGVRWYRDDQLKQKRSYLSRIVQTGPQREALKTTYLAELMQVCADHPSSVAFFNPEAARKRLLDSPVIKEARVHVVKPDTIFVDYTVRQPVAWLYDFENIALDEQGYPFPIYPFFTPKKLPQIYLGIGQFFWNQPLADQKAALALKILNFVKTVPLQLVRIDVSSAFETRLGHREVVVIVEERGFTKILRLTPKNFAQEFSNYLELVEKLPAEPQVIDLRIPRLAFMTKEGYKPQSH